MIPLPFELQMEPHDKLVGVGIINHFRSLNDAAPYNVAARVIGYLQGNALVFPVG